MHFVLCATHFKYQSVRTSEPSGMFLNIRYIFLLLFFFCCIELISMVDSHVMKKAVLDKRYIKHPSIGPRHAMVPGGFGHGKGRSKFSYCYLILLNHFTLETRNPVVIRMTARFFLSVGLAFLMVYPS